MMGKILHHRIPVVIIASLCLWPLTSEAQKFYPDDPLLVDRDNQHTEEPAEIELSQIYDMGFNTFVKTRDKSRPPAANVNTLGEVPDSSWFTNRIGSRKMSIDEIVRGPNRHEGPDTTHPWIVLRGKTQGVTPGFTIRDSRGDVYFVKFDPKDFPQLATSAEVISTKFFYAFGYNVPENYLAKVSKEQFELSPEATIRGVDGKRRKMDKQDLDLIFRLVPIQPDGTIQVVASRGIDGKELGPFLYSGTRSDDPNDIFPHEDRRELRGMRVFSAWLNHDDSRSINTDDWYQTEGGRSYIKHYLIDFGSTLGSGSVKLQSRRAGNEYLIEWGPIFHASATFGIWDRPWRKVKYPYFEFIGRFEADFFRPELWRPEYPNPAFDRMDASDAFWAVQKLIHVTDDRIRAVVEAGKLVNKDAENYLVETLIQRRDKIIHYYVREINPVSYFSLSGGDLLFRNLGVESGLASNVSYRYRWYNFDNKTGEKQPLGEEGKTTTASIPVPASGAEFMMVMIQTEASGMENWEKPVEVYLRNATEKSVVGVERE